MYTQGWKKLEKLEMPAAVSEHCTVTLDGRKGKEVIITGGRGRETRALRLDVKTQRSGIIQYSTVIFELRVSKTMLLKVVLNEQNDHWSKEARVCEGG